MTQTEIFYELLQRRYSDFFSTPAHKAVQEKYRLEVINESEYKMQAVAEAFLLLGKALVLDDKAREQLNKPQVNF